MGQCWPLVWSYITVLHTQCRENGLIKGERRTLCHSFFFFWTAVLRVSKSVLHRTSASVMRWILNKNPLQKWWRGNIYYICCLCLGRTLWSTSFWAPHVKGLQNIVRIQNNVTQSRSSEELFCVCLFFFHRSWNPERVWMGVRWAHSWWCKLIHITDYDISPVME